MTPTLDNELDGILNGLLEYGLSFTTGYVKGALSPSEAKQAIKSLLREVELEARKDELNSIPLINTPSGTWANMQYITDRIKELDNLLGSK